MNRNTNKNENNMTNIEHEIDLDQLAAVAWGRTAQDILNQPLRYHTQKNLNKYELKEQLRKMMLNGDNSPEKQAEVDAIIDKIFVWQRCRPMGTE